MTVSIDDIRAAAEVIDGEVLRTPSSPSQPISALSGAQVVLKLENLQHTGSFTPRGALVRLAGMDADAAKAGVVAASAGNHAQGVAFHARRRGIPATIVMPTGTAFTKVASTEALGARVVLHGGDVGEAGDHARNLADAATTPALTAAASMPVSLTSAPRGLKAPVYCRFSRLRPPCAPLRAEIGCEGIEGVRRPSPSNTSAAARISSRETVMVSFHCVAGGACGTSLNTPSATASRSPRVSPRRI